MPELSTLLRQRLRSAENRTLQHPDPDTLNAYVEELLLSPERERTLQHLSLCSQCREVVALIMPETEIAAESPLEEAPAAAAVIASPRNTWRDWFRSPAFGFAGSVAATVLGVALILRLSPNPQTAGSTSTARHVEEAKSQPLVAANLPAAVAPSPKQLQIPAVAAPQLAQNTPAPAAHTAPASTAALRHEPSTPRSKPSGREITVAKSSQPAPVVVADLRQQDYINKAFLANSYETQPAITGYRNLPQSPAPLQSTLTFAPPAVVAGNAFQSSSGFVIPPNSAGSNRGVLAFYATETESGRSSTLIGKIVELGKRPLGRMLRPPISSSSLGTTAMFRPGMVTGQGSDSILAAKNSSETSSLSESQAFSSRALGSSPENNAAGASQFQWKVVQGKLLRSSDLNHWTEQNPGSDNLEFSVVSPNGLEVWAGGAQAALVHSRDGGSTWQRITLGSSATGTITSIEAAGQNVLVKSSSGQSWASQDGGNSWTLQD
ncbi:MAG TPA: YCF48-related protein [Candidatus Angelobacter sp.]|nr:YCF48-related protein [Candidatus Angelobacter sp.]